MEGSLISRLVVPSISNSTFRNNLALFGFGGAINFQGEIFQFRIHSSKTIVHWVVLTQEEWHLGVRLLSLPLMVLFDSLTLYTIKPTLGAVGIMGSGNEYAQFEHCTFTSNFAIEGGAFAVGVQGSFSLTVSDTSLWRMVLQQKEEC
jgi:hypothetical protein